MLGLECRGLSGPSSACNLRTHTWRRHPTALTAQQGAGLADKNLRQRAHTDSRTRARESAHTARRLADAPDAQLRTGAVCHLLSLDWLEKISHAVCVSDGPGLLRNGACARARTHTFTHKVVPYRAKVWVPPHPKQRADDVTREPPKGPQLGKSL